MSKKISAARVYRILLDRVQRIEADATAVADVLAKMIEKETQAAQDRAGSTQAPPPGV